MYISDVNCIPYLIGSFRDKYVIKNQVIRINFIEIRWIPQKKPKVLGNFFKDV